MIPGHFIKITINDGSFKTTLRMQISCENIVLTCHVEENNLKAMCISPIIQNNLIIMCGKIVQDKCICSINNM